MSFGGQKNVIIVGCGFLGKAAALLFASRGWKVTGISRHPLCSEKKFSSLACDVTDSAAVAALKEKIPSDALLLYSVSSNKGGAESYAAIYRDGLRRVMEAWQPRKTIFVSSTSVYAQTNGEIVTELSLAEPTRETSRVLLEAEKIALNARGIVARFSGIYGPGRSVLLEKFLNGTAIIDEGKERYINQIHRDDGAQALYHLATTPEAHRIYNITDDTPATQQEVYQWIADYFHKPLPPKGPADLNRKRGWTSKKVSNTRLKGLGWQPAFPSYRDALPSCIAAVEAKS